MNDKELRKLIDEVLSNLDKVNTVLERIVKRQKNLVDKMKSC